jgi:recombination protein RecT
LTEPKTERETHAHDGHNLTEKTMETQAPAVIPRTSLRSLLNSDQVKAEIGRALPEHLTADRFVRVALTALTRTPKLADCSRESFMRCMMDCSALGIEPDGRRAHLIPYGKECQLILDYKGLIELARRSGDIASIRAELVCEADEFGWRNGEITHEVNWRAARGDIQAVYAIATLRSGETQSAVLTRDEVDAIRKRSRAGSSGPWVSDYGEMAKKTAVRRLCKMLPLSVELADAMERDDDRLTERNVTPVKLSLPEPEPALDVTEAQEEATEGGAE